MKKSSSHRLLITYSFSLTVSKACLRSALEMALLVYRRDQDYSLALEINHLFVCRLHRYLKFIIQPQDADMSTKWRGNVANIPRASLTNGSIRESPIDSRRRPMTCDLGNFRHGLGLSLEPISHTCYGYKRKSPVVSASTLIPCYGKWKDQ